MSATILRHTPTSGIYPEYYFGEPAGLWTWIQFEDNQFESWHGCFAGSACYAYNKVITDKENEIALVVAAGILYLVDINSRNTIDIQINNSELFTGIISTRNPDFLIASSYSTIYLFEDKELIKEIKPDIITDGIYLTSQQGNKLTGDFYRPGDDYNTGFELDLANFEISYNEKIRIDRKDFEQYKILD